jgi:exodeoxyribonuclease III
MKIATFNVNGVNGRLPVLLRWLAETKPDVACLQELKAPQEKFPEAAIRQAGYGAIWHGQKSWNGVAILARGLDPLENRRDLPGDPDDIQSRYIEAQIDGVLVGCLYLPNGNPAPGPKFDYTPDPASEGQNVSGIKDVLGRPFGKMFLEVAASSSGEGWVHYMYPEPETSSRPGSPPS